MRSAVLRAVEGLHGGLDALRRHVDLRGQLLGREVGVDDVSPELKVLLVQPVLRLLDGGAVFTLHGVPVKVGDAVANLTEDRLDVHLLGLEGLAERLGIGAEEVHPRGRALLGAGADAESGQFDDHGNTLSHLGMRWARCRPRTPCGGLAAGPRMGICPREILEIYRRTSHVNPDYSERG